MKLLLLLLCPVTLLAQTTRDPFAPAAARRGDASTAGDPFADAAPTVAAVRTAPSKNFFLEGVLPAVDGKTANVTVIAARPEGVFYFVPEAAPKKLSEVSVVAWEKIDEKKFALAFPAAATARQSPVGLAAMRTEWAAMLEVKPRGHRETFAEVYSLRLKSEKPGAASSMLCFAAIAKADAARAAAANPQDKAASALKTQTDFFARAVEALVSGRGLESDREAVKKWFAANAPLGGNADPFQ